MVMPTSAGPVYTTSASPLLSLAPPTVTPTAPLQTDPPSKRKVSTYTAVGSESPVNAGSNLPGISEDPTVPFSDPGQIAPGSSISLDPAGEQTTPSSTQSRNAADPIAKSESAADPTTRFSYDPLSTTEIPDGFDKRVPTSSYVAEPGQLGTAMPWRSQPLLSSDEDHTTSSATVAPNPQSIADPLISAIGQLVSLVETPGDASRQTVPGVISTETTAQSNSVDRTEYGSPQIDGTRQLQPPPKCLSCLRSAS